MLCDVERGERRGLRHSAVLCDVERDERRGLFHPAVFCDVERGERRGLFHPAVLCDLERGERRGLLRAAVRRQAALRGAVCRPRGEHDVTGRQQLRRVGHHHGGSIHQVI